MLPIHCYRALMAERALHHTHYAFYAHKRDLKAAMIRNPFPQYMTRFSVTLLDFCKGALMMERAVHYTYYSRCAKETWKKQREEVFLHNVLPVHCYRALMGESSISQILHNSMRAKKTWKKRQKEVFLHNVLPAHCYRALMAERALYHTYYTTLCAHKKTRKKRRQEVFLHHVLPVHYHRALMVERAPYHTYYTTLCAQKRPERSDDKKSSSLWSFFTFFCNYLLWFVAM